MTTRSIVGGVAATALATIMMACGGSSSPTSPSGSGGGGSSSGPGPVGATITLTSSGVNPANVTINVGQSISLVNNDSRAHEISSNPHPVHTDCPALNFGTLNPGQSKTSDALTVARSCGYHDHLDPSNSLWQGQVTVR
jgi:plastocyanin